MGDELDLSAQLTLRTEPSELARLERLAGLIPKSVVARLALRLGLDRLERDPGLIARLAKPPRLGRPPGKRAKPD